MAEPGYEGFKALGEMLGGGIGTPGTYQKALKAGYSTEEQLQQARRARALAMIDLGRLDARQAVTPDLLQRALGGDVGAQAELGASVLGGNQTMNLGQLGKYQQPHYGEMANVAHDAILGSAPAVAPDYVLGDDEDAAYAKSLAGGPTLGGAPDAALYNRVNAYMAGKSYQPTQVLGGAYVPDGMTIDAINAVPTPETLSRIEKNEAQGRAAETRANKPPAAHAAKPPSAAAAEAEVVAQARDRIAAGADPKKVADYLRSKGYPGAAKKIAP